MIQMQKAKLVSAPKKDPRHLGVMVTQRLDEGHGPGPIRVFRTVLVEESVGTNTKVVPLRVPLDLQLPAGTDALTPSDKKAFAEQGLSGPQIAYVELKLRAKKTASDAHMVAFEADKARRLRENLKERLIAQLLADPQLAADVISAMADMPSAAGAQHAAKHEQSQQRTLGDKVLQMLALLDDIRHEIVAYKASAKVGKNFDQNRLNGMFNEPAAQAWKLAWFAFSDMVEQATGTPFARSKDWRRKPDNARLAAAHGYKSTGALS